MISVTVQGPGCRATCCFKVALCNSWGAGFNPQCRAELCIIQRILHHVCLNAVHVPSSRSTEFLQLLSCRCHMEGYMQNISYSFASMSSCCSPELFLLWVSWGNTHVMFCRLSGCLDSVIFMSSLLISGQSDYCGHAFKIMASDSMLGEHQTRGPCFPNRHDLLLFSFLKWSLYIHPIHLIICLCRKLAQS